MEDVSSQWVNRFGLIGCSRVSAVTSVDIDVREEVGRSVAIGYATKFGTVGDWLEDRGTSVLDLELGEVSFSSTEPA